MNDLLLVKIQLMRADGTLVYQQVGDASQPLGSPMLDTALPANGAMLLGFKYLPTISFDDRNEEQLLRREIWLSHVCGQQHLYGDDGEMQCHKCGIDFKRQMVREIVQRLEAEGLKRLAAAR